MTGEEVHLGSVAGPLNHLCGRIDQLMRQVDQAADSACYPSEFQQAFEELQGACQRLARQQQALSAAHAQLQGERDLYRKLFDLAPEGCVLTDACGTIREANRTAGALLGAHPRLFQGKALVCLVALRDRAALRATLREMAGTAVGRELRVRLRPRCGHPFEAEVKVAAVRGDSELTLCWSFRDITARRRLHRRLLVNNARFQREIARRSAEVEEVSRIMDLCLQREQDARAEAERASQAKDQFMAILSHELRIPLEPVLAAATALALQEDLPERVRADARMIQRNIELEARLIDDLLDLTRVTRGKLRLDFAPVDVHALVGNVMEICRSEIPIKRLQTSLALQAIRSFVSGDGARLHQVLWNLLRNAIKFTPENGRIAIRTWNELRPEDAQPRLFIEVSDTGIGIEAAMLPRLFNAFEQGEHTATRRYGGLGLGLAITKGLVQAHGGAISAHSPGRGHGSIFTVALPAIAAPPSAAAAPAASAPAELPPAEALTILLVEDHEDTLRVLTRLLEGLGHHVLPARTVEDALRLSESAPFDLLVSDLGLPDASGFDLLRRLREKTSSPGIALSGYGAEDDVRRSTEAGFAEHLTKPVNFQALHAAILRTVSARRHA